MIAILLALTLFAQHPQSETPPASQPSTQPATSRPAIDFSPLTDALERYVAACDLPGGAMIIMRGDEILYERYVGSYSNKTVVPIASASKWLSGAVMMALVDDGKIALDAPISTYLPQFTGDKAAITVRQLFSHTSGLPTEHVMVHNHRVTLAEAVDAIAKEDLVTAPGSEFRYGGVSMHVAARIAEVVSGKSWHELFAETITGPLRMTTTRFGLGLTKNPSPAGGAGSSLHDYAAFLRMIAAGGTVDGRRVLSPEAVETMLTDQTRGGPMKGAVARMATGSRYGIGNWVNQVNSGGTSVVNSSPGAFGFMPWVDRKRNVIGIFMIDDRAGARKRVENLPDIREVTNAVLDGKHLPVAASRPAASSQPAASQPQRLRDRIINRRRKPSDSSGG
jgi:serine-type D-Ala-D-Ala carboxypeptidase/endopeptidase